MGRNSMLKKKAKATNSTEQKSKASRSSRSWDRVANIATAASPIVTLLSILLIFWQTNLIADQSELAAKTQQEETRSNDIRFLSSVYADVSDATITITNRSETTVTTSELWILETYEDNSRVNEIFSTIRGVPACSRLEVDRKSLSKTLEPTTDDGATYTPPADATYEVNFVTQSPSGVWYLVANSGHIERIDFENTDLPAPDDDWLDALNGSPKEALKQSNLYQISADTYWEGYNSVREYHSPLISGGDIVTGAPFPAEIELDRC